MHLNVHSSTAHSSQDTQAPARPPADEAAEKAGRAHEGLPLGHREKEMASLSATRMNPETITLSKVSPKEKDTHRDITYRNLKRDVNGLIYKPETDSQTQKTALWLPKREMSGG